MMQTSRTPLPLANATMRRLALSVHGLAEAPRRRMTAQHCLSLVERMGYVQVDSVTTVERAHHMILGARCHGYRPALLTRLVERDRTLFENWTHDAALIPTRFFPYWSRRFAAERRRMGTSGWWKRHAEGFSATIDRVRARIAAEGPLMARDFDGERVQPSTGWWDWTPSKSALEFLWRTGEVAIAGRVGFQKVYDLTERVIPKAHRTTPPDDEAIVDWACRGALDRLGVATAAEIAAFWDIVTLSEAKAWIARQHPDDIVQVSVEGADGRRHAAVAASGRLDRIEEVPTPPAGLRLLSPFDPLIRDRRRLGRLFGFDYRFEAFTPAEKRLYGYYVFPLLEGERLVGRIDLRAQRQEGCLSIDGLWWEQGVRDGRGRRAALGRELDRIRRAVGLDRVEDRRGTAAGGLEAGGATG